MKRIDKLYRINDVLTQLGAELGVSLDDDTLNDLTHHVADTFGLRDEET